MLVRSGIVLKSGSTLLSNNMSNFHAMTGTALLRVVR